MENKHVDMSEQTSQKYIASQNQIVSNLELLYMKKYILYF